MPKKFTFFILASPIILYIVIGAIFIIATRLFSKEIGYLVGFVCYWLFFGIILPAILKRAGQFHTLLKDRRTLFNRSNFVATMLWIVITGVTLIMYGRDFISARISIILIAIVMAVINGYCEEIYWRGVFVRAFPTNPWLAIVYPAAGFAFWHFIPQSVFSVENLFSFILSTFFLGLAYGFIAYHTGSAKWTAISHSISGILALSGYLAPSLEKLISR